MDNNQETKKHELLAPAGDMECLMQAISNGADAVYVGLQQFGARKFAKNFDNNEIVQAVNLCHLYGVKLFVTMNTLIKDSEVGEFLGQVDYLYKIGVDALIMQDYGMICLVRERYPDFDIHASTQANNTAKETVDMFYNLGVKRVVFSRELNLDEIAHVHVPIEKEIFIHGALCVCYSGCCLMSSMLGDRSANRGECAGCCRLPYTLKRRGITKEEEAYLLSTKELNTSPKIKELVDSDIYSFKIEGRMKSPEYVGFVTRFYRNLIDTYGETNSFEQDTDKLKTIFNREYTVGRLFNASDEDLMNTETPNHIGLEIGKVIEVNEKKIKIELEKELNQQDGIRFMKAGTGFIVNYLYDENDNLTNSVGPHNICYVDNKVGLTNRDTVCKTLDYNLNQSLKKLHARNIPITIKLTAKIGQPLFMEISDGVYTISKESVSVEQAEKVPLPMERIKEQVEKLGDTPFISRNTIIDMDANIFISIKELNELRRSLAAELQNKRMESARVNNPANINYAIPNTEPEKGFTVEVETKDQLEFVYKMNPIRIYTSNEELYNMYKMDDKVYYKAPRCYPNIEGNLKRRNLINDYFQFDTKEDIIGDSGLNVYNIYTAYYLYKNSLNNITLSLELSKDEIINFINTYATTFNKYPRIEVFVYGRVENMIIKGNILNLDENDKTYELIDGKDRHFPVYYDGYHTHLMNYTITNREDLVELKDFITFRFKFENETTEEIENIINSYIKIE